MAYTPEDFEQKLKEVRYAATAMQARISELARIAAGLMAQVPDWDGDTPYTCPECGLAWHSDERMQDHRANVHGVTVRVAPNA